MTGTPFVPLDPAPAVPFRAVTVGVRERLWRSVGCRAFRWTFHNWYGARRAILRWFGARVHASARVRATARITAPWNLSIGEESAVGDHAVLLCHAPLSIGRYCTISQYAMVCSGGYEPGDAAFTLRAAPVRLEDDAWIAADAYVGPGVTVGTGGIVGSRASVFADVPGRTVVTGPSGESRSARRGPGAATDARLLHSCPNFMPDAAVRPAGHAATL